MIKCTTHTLGFRSRGYYLYIIVDSFVDKRIRSTDHVISMIFSGAFLIHICFAYNHHQGEYYKAQERCVDEAYTVVEPVKNTVN